MARLPIDFPAGLYRNGTQLQSQGRWYDANLMRFYEGSKMPWGGWRFKSASAVTGKPRAIITWVDNSKLTWAAIGTESKLYAMNRLGTLFDITPVGFVPGIPNAVSGGGYGSGLYGMGTYGTPRSDSSLVQDASVWSLDLFGQDLVGVMADDGKIYEWTLNTATPAAQVSGSPTARAVLVTEQRIMMALGAAGNPRKVQWSDQEDDTDWTPGPTNQAGDFDLQTNGRLMQGVRISAANLLLTDQDAHVATYTADNLVYSFNRVGEGCGAVSQNCVAVPDARAFWMGQGNFWTYNGYVAPLPCDVSDYVFSDFNIQQQSKVSCILNSQFGEIIWQYCSGSSLEIDRYVVFNYRENHWNIGKLVRLSGADRGVFQYPLRCGNDGFVYEHEVGFTYDTGVMPYLEGGPIELGNGDQVAYINGLIPDDKTLGDVNATFFVRFEPDDADTQFGPYTLASKTDLRIACRQARVRFTGVTLSDWRVGIPRIDLIQGGNR